MRRFGTSLLMVVAAAGCRRAPTVTPLPLCDAGDCAWNVVGSAVDSAVRAGAAPGAVVAISVAGRRYLHAAGQLGSDMPGAVGPSTVYDLASLTKVVALTTVTMFAVADGRIRLDDPVQHYLPEFMGAGKDQVTVRNLLTHSSGLPAHRALWREAPGRDSALALVARTPLDTVPGARMVYSDLGAILLTRIVEHAYGQPVDRLFARLVARPLHLGSTRYLPPRSWLSRVAPTERDPWRGRLVHGEVHDENAAFLGGVSGHAGLFSDATDLLTFGEWLLGRRKPQLARPGPALDTDVVQAFTRRPGVVAGSSRALGWDTPSQGSSAGNRLSPESFGHTGFTGTSIWIDPTRDLVVVLLSNRVNPTRDNPRLGPLRVLVADLAVEALETRR